MWRKVFNAVISSFENLKYNPRDKMIEVETLVDNVQKEVKKDNITIKDEDEFRAELKAFGLRKPRPTKNTPNPLSKEEITA